MNLIRTFVPNSFANYNHLAICLATNEAAAIDPFSADHLVELANKHQVTITQIWITHEHGDHIKDLTELRQMTGAKVSAPVSCQGRFEADVWLDDNSKVNIGKEQAQFFLTPGHTPGHGVFFCDNRGNAERPFLVCGDTLFNAGVGNVRSGDVDELFTTIEHMHNWLPDDCEIYSGHDYLETNLKFTLHHCPELTAAQALLGVAERQTPNTRAIQTWGEEKTYNLFLQLDSNRVADLTGIQNSPSARSERFKALRVLRDQW